MIKGGYILQPRIIQESDISVAPPYVREIWMYLLREANSRDNKYSGHEIKRGQLFRSYEDIREGTKWFIGWRKMTYNENQTKKAMKFLRDTGRIDTTKELGGVMITVCKYDYYQDPKNYDRTTIGTTDRTIEEPLPNQPLPDNNKNEEELKERKESKYDDFDIFWDKYHLASGLPKTDKSDTLKKWSKLTKAEKEKAIEMIKPYCDSIDNKKFCKKARTYLEAKSYNDEIKKTVVPFMMP